MAVRSLAQSSLRQNPQLNSMLGGYQPNMFHHLETVRLGGSAASVEFTNLGRYFDYQHLQLRLITQDGRTSANNSPVALRFNNDTGTNYSSHGLDSNGSSLTSFNEVNVNRIWITGGNSTVGFGVSITDILDSFDTTKNKVTRTKAGTAGSPFSSETGKTISLSSAAWRNLDPITSIQITPFSGNFAAGSRFSLYGIRVKQ